MEHNMEWQELQDGLAGRFALNDGTQVIGIIRETDHGITIEFFADSADIASVETQSEKLGRLPDLIDDLQPQAVIDICARMDKESKAI
jgi:hypothetical protein